MHHLYWFQVQQLAFNGLDPSVPHYYQHTSMTLTDSFGKDYKFVICVKCSLNFILKC